MDQNNAGKVPPLTAAEAAQTLGVKTTPSASAPADGAIPVQHEFGRKRYAQRPVGHRRRDIETSREANGESTTARTRLKRCVRFTTRSIDWRKPKSK